MNTQKRPSRSTASAAMVGAAVLFLIGLVLLPDPDPIRHLAGVLGILGGIVTFIQGVIDYAKADH